MPERSNEPHESAEIVERMAEAIGIVIRTFVISLLLFVSMIVWALLTFVIADTIDMGEEQAMILSGTIVAAAWIFYLSARRWSEKVEMETE